MKKYHLVIAIIGALGAVFAALILVVIPVFIDYFNKPAEESVKIHEVRVRAEGYKSEVVSKPGARVVVIVESVYGKDDGVTKSGTIRAPEGWRIASYKHSTSKALGKRQPSASLTRGETEIQYSIYVKHGPWYDRWRNKATLSIDHTLIQDGKIPWISEEIVAYKDQIPIEGTTLEFKLPKALVPPEGITLERYVVNVDAASTTGSNFIQKLEFSSSKDNQDYRFLNCLIHKRGAIIGIDRSPEIDKK